MTLLIRMTSVLLDFRDGTLAHCPNLAAAKDTLEKVAALRGVKLRAVAAGVAELSEVVL